MAIDGCDKSFPELAQTVLPQYMVDLRKAIKTPKPLSAFAEPGVGPVTLCRRFGYKSDPIGCYVIIDNKKPIYVGISKHIFQRLMEHVRQGDHYTATLAYRMAATRNPHNGTAKEAMKNKVFRRRFDESRQELLSMSVAFIEIINPLELYLFEAYCAMMLDTCKWNTFRTH
jgi:predicted GIY-YIG superfamily endonuclease